MLLEIDSRHLCMHARYHVDQSTQATVYECALIHKKLHHALVLGDFHTSFMVHGIQNVIKKERKGCNSLTKYL